MIVLDPSLILVLQVIVKRNRKERHLPQLKKPKFLVYEELTVGEFHADLR